MSAALHVLTVGYAGDRVAGTVCLINDGDRVIVVDPGMVAGRDLILGPLAERGFEPGDVTDVVISHHHPDHTVNIALFLRARVHDFQATYLDDQWLDHDADIDLTASVRLLATPGHTPQDLTTLVTTDDGLVALTHLWWTADGPADDPFSTDREQLAGSRRLVLGLAPQLVVPGHGAPFRPDAGTVI